MKHEPQHKCDKCAAKDSEDCDVCKWDKVRRWPHLRSMFEEKK